jgi:hypothetical protein
MGTAHEWFLVLVVGFPFAGLLGWVNYPRPKFVQPPRIYWTLLCLGVCPLRFLVWRFGRFRRLAALPPSSCLS